MNKLVLGSLLLAALVSQTTGCVTEDLATIDAEWSFRTVAPMGQVSPPNLCPAGVDTVALHVQELDASDRPFGPEIVDVFDCDTMADFSDPLEPGAYSTYLEFSGSGGFYANSLATVVDVTDVDKTFTAQIIENGGYFKLAWDLKSQATAAPLTCSQLMAGKDRIGITATLITNTSIFVPDNFDCELGETFATFTDPVAKGTYDVAIEPIDSNGGSLGPSVVFMDKVMGDRNSVTDLGVATLAFP